MDYGSLQKPIPSALRDAKLADTRAMGYFVHVIRGS